MSQLPPPAPAEAHADVALPTLLRRDRVIVLAALVAIAAVAWTIVVRVALAMEGAEAAMAMSHLPSRGAADFAALVALWVVMMVAMMVPPTASVVLLVAGLTRRGGAHGPLAPTALFLVGYLSVWMIYSVVAAAFQVALHDAALLSPRMESANRMLGGTLLLAAGLFQWTPLKQACLAHCRTPIRFLGAHWQEGRLGAARMGLQHGVYCVGCCWLLMALLFVAGVMNLQSVAALAAFVLLERVLPGGQRMGKVAGAVLAGVGIGTLMSSVI